MEWRERILQCVGPGVLGGITFSQWSRILREETLDIGCLPRAMAIALQSVKNSLVNRAEERRYKQSVDEVSIQAPIFILGHWRNGTTHLHHLLAQDQRFAFPNGYQTSFPHTFLTAESTDSPWMSFFVPKRRPMDNVEWSLSSPQEDEFALCASTLKSPCMGWVFPRRRDYYGRYLTFRSVSEGEIAEWRTALRRFLRKLTFKHRRRLVLKSPPHTCRIRLLLEMFPDAKFVHIHRDPYVVFQSSRKMFRMMFRWHNLQRVDLSDLDSWILKQFREMYDCFFEERGLIPRNAYHELAFEDLEKNPVDELRKMYATLDLPDFSVVEPAIERYVGSLRGYRKNEFPILDKELKAQIDSLWRAPLQEWNYAA